MWYESTVNSVETGSKPLALATELRVAEHHIWVAWMVTAEAGVTSGLWLQLAAVAVTWIVMAHSDSGQVIWTITTDGSRWQWNCCSSRQCTIQCMLQSKNHATLAQNYVQQQKLRTARSPSNTVWPWPRPTVMAKSLETGLQLSNSTINVLLFWNMCANPAQ